MKYQKPLGTEDILPEQIPTWRFVEDATHRVFECYGYSEIRTPVMEFYSLFNRSVGEATDIIEKEMYLLRSKDETDDKDILALRPELTAPVVRAYLEHNMDKTKRFQKLYYIGPLFRHERPQKGRQRQFHQIGVEAIGSDDYLMDVEVIDLAMSYLHSLGIMDCQLNLNSMGCPECRKAYSEALKRQLEPHLNNLCENCQRRFHKNILRILDCKNRKCYEIYSKLESLDNYLCQSCKEHFGKVKNGLDDNGIIYRLNKQLVRGFDYYTQTVFEITDSSLGAQDAICGGGRYNNLVGQFGGPDTPAVGFAMGMERIVWILQNAIKKEIQPHRPIVYIIVTDEQLRPQAFKIMRDLRQHSITADMDYEGKSVKAQFRNADRLKARFVAVVGPEELARESLKLKEMATGTEREIKLTSFIETIRPTGQATIRKE